MILSGYTEMVRLMKRAAVDAVESGKPCDVLFGTVQGVAPLEIFVEMGMVLQADELIVGERLTDHTVELSFDDAGVKQVFTTWDMEEQEESAERKISFTRPVRHRVTVYGGLQVGEQVILLRKQNGQRFVVLDRVVNV